MTTPPLLEASDVYKSYRLGKREIPVLRGVDLRVEPGEMVALLGASGAGKSTLLHVLGLLDPPTRGTVRFDGIDVHDLPARRKAVLRHRHVGFVFQFYHLIPELDALQNVLLGRMMEIGPLQWLRVRRQAKDEAATLLRDVGMGDRLHHRPKALSGGERQRVAICRALMARPRVILADEPTGNLDSKTAEEVMELLFRIHDEQDIAFLMVTHNEAIAARCSRIVRMADGVVEG